MTVEVFGRSGDGGIDGIGVLRVNLLSFPGPVRANVIKAQSAPLRSAISAARWGRGGTRSVHYHGHVHADAKREANRDGAPAIDLIDGDHLCDLLKQLNLGVRTEMVEKMTVEPECKNHKEGVPANTFGICERGHGLGDGHRTNSSAALYYLFDSVH